jgi:hypothetical protein
MSCEASQRLAWGAGKVLLERKLVGQVYETDDFSSRLLVWARYVHSEASGVNLTFGFYVPRQ